MSHFVMLETKGDPNAAAAGFLRRLLETGRADAVFVQARTPYSQLPMPGLIADPAHMEAARPLAPAAPFNAARQAARLLRHPTGRTVALVLRPCEIRALVELVKLNQCVLDEALIVGLDCFGRMENADFLASAAGSDAGRLAAGAGVSEKLTTTCGSCDAFVPENADIALRLFGLPLKEHIGLEALSPAGEETLKALGLTAGTGPETRVAAVAGLLEERRSAKEKLFRETAEKTRDLDGLQRFLADCLNCLNCRVACPVCYCRECVFTTAVFDHEPEVYFRRAGLRGRIKLPTETTMYHLTRLAHMSHACVGCGQCSSVCPSHIPVADLFRAVSSKTQELFDYIPGADPGQPIPYLAFGRAEENA